MNSQAADRDAMVRNIQISYKTSIIQKIKANNQLRKHIVNKWVLRAVLKVWSEEITWRLCGSVFQNLAAETQKALPPKLGSRNLGTASKFSELDLKVRAGT